MNWAKATTLITRKKFGKKKTKLIKNVFANLSERGGGKGSNKFECKLYKYEQPTTTNVLKSDVTICLYGVFDALPSHGVKPT